MSLRILPLTALAGLLAITVKMSPQQAPGTVLVNQMQIPVNFQVIDPNTAMMQTSTLAAGANPMMTRPGCLRLSTGKPAKTVYYVVELYGRYAFRANGHRITLVDMATEAIPGQKPFHETTSRDEACKIYRKLHGPKVPPPQ